jgi:ubiquinone/menaquinone biosynthesis C-methylase UbiE
MGVYRSIVFPRLMDFGMAAVASFRSSVLAGVSGDILEVGFGTGLNLPHYPPGVRRITAVDTNPGMHPLARRRVRATGIEVDLRTEDAANLSFPDQHFDSVVSTWTLCSIPQVEDALAEMYRVLKPGGRFFFIEHGLSSDADVRKWQHRLTPVNRCLLDGCHLNRDIRALVKSQPWRLEHLDEFYAPRAPKTAGYFYAGRARREDGGVPENR